MTEEEKRSALDFLPEAMVDELLSQQSGVVDSLASKINQMEQMRDTIRRALEGMNLLENAEDLIQQKVYPTTAGIDGTCAVIRQVLVDTVGIAAVAVEGLTPPSETRVWEKPHHLVKVKSVNHFPELQTVARGIMFSFELLLASRAPHRVVMLDGSLTTHLIALGQCLRVLDEAPPALRDIIAPNLEDTLRVYVQVLTSPRADITWIGLPKYSSRCEVGMRLKERLGGPYPLGEISDKGLLTHVLEAGEVIRPLELTIGRDWVNRGLARNADRWHLTLGGREERVCPRCGRHTFEQRCETCNQSTEPTGTVLPPDWCPPDKFDVLEDLRKQIVQALNELCVFYYKPTSDHPALRVEVAKRVAENPSKLSVVLEALSDQCRYPGIMEPYPLHIADEFAKRACEALFELRDSSLSEVAERTNPRAAYTTLRDYRTETWV
jgi:rRNA maturation protein Nop10